MWDYRAALLRVTDGDTIEVLADTGFHGRQEVDLRLTGVSAPERNQPGGSDTAVFVQNWLAAQAMPGFRWPWHVHTEINTKVEPDERLTFTRYLGMVTSFKTGESLNQAVIDYLAAHPEWGSGT